MSVTSLLLEGRVLLERVMSKTMPRDQTPVHQHPDHDNGDGKHERSQEATVNHGPMVKIQLPGRIL